MLKLALWLGIVTAFVAAACEERAMAQEITSEHPRIYFREADVAPLRATAATNVDIQRLVTWTNNILRSEAAERSTDMYVDSTASYTWVQGAAFTAVITGEQRHIDLAKRFVWRLVPRAPTDGLVPVRNRLLGMALGFDWLFNSLTTEEKNQLASTIVAYVDSLASLLDDEAYVSGPARWTNITSLAGCLAVNGYVTDLDDTLPMILHTLRDGYTPFLDQVGVGGGHQMASYYGAGYSQIEGALMWRTASETHEQWSEAYYEQAPFFAIYAANGSYALPPLEDAGSDAIQTSTRSFISYGSGLFGNGYAETFENELNQPGNVPVNPQELIPRIMTRATAATPRPIEELPLSRFFSGSGFLIARDSWNRQQATTIVFKASPFFSVGHHQRDEGHFVIDYLGPLLVDGGYYDGSTTTDHYRNFYARTVAHNSLIVPSATEDNPLSSRMWVNDGGQKVQAAEPQNLADTHAARWAHRGMIAHSDADVCVWGKADLADTYATEKLTAYTRDLLEIRRPSGSTHPVILVVDRTQLVGARPASVLWQFGQEATVSGSRISSSNAGGAQIRLDVLRPEEPAFQSFFGATKWIANGVDHPPTEQHGDWPYWGRVEVSPATDDDAPVWSTLIRIGDASLATDTMTPVNVSGTDWTAARLGNTLFVSASPTTSSIELPDGAPLVDGCIAGLEAFGHATVTIGTGAPVEVIANGEGLAVYSPTGEPTDAGTPEVDGGMTPDASGTGGAPAPGGCGCEVTGSVPQGRSIGAILFALATVLLTLRARRRKNV